VTWKLVYTKQAQKDAKKLASSGLKPKAQELLALIAEDPYRKPPPFEKLIGDLAGQSRRNPVSAVLLPDRRPPDEWLKTAPITP